MRWTAIPLECVTERFISGGTPSTSDTSFWGGHIPWITGADFNNDEVNLGRRTIKNDALINTATNLVPKRSVLLVTRTGVGKSAIATQDIAISQDITGIVLKPGFNAKFVLYAIKSSNQILISAQRGATIKGVTRNVVKKLPIPFIAISEQNRIVEILDEADRLRRLRREADAKAARILPALFLKMFGDPETNPKNLPVVKLGTIIQEGPQNGLYKPSSSYGNGIRILRIDGFYSGQVTDLSILKRLEIDPDEINKYSLRKNDIVVNRVNSEEYLGKSAIIPVLEEPVVFESNMMRFSVDLAQVVPLFVIAHLQTSFTKKEILQRAKRAINQASINQQDIRALSILKPPIELQIRFASIVKETNLTLSIMATAMGKLDNLFDLLLRQAFSGQLTAKWREARSKELLAEMEQQARLLNLPLRKELELGL